MAVEIVPFAPEHFEKVRRFAEQTWQRPRGAAFYRWRYDEAPDTRAYLALRDGECLAMGCAFRRPYRLGDEIVPFLETFDWYAIPGLRNVGLGVRIIQRFMAEAEPLILVGGSDEARDFLARLKWQPIAVAKRYGLRLRAGLAGGLTRRLRLPRTPARALAAAVLLRDRPRSRSAPRGGRVLAVASAGPEVDALYRGPVAYGTLALWTEERLRWLTSGFAGAGHFVPLYFALGEALVGFALLRIFGTETGQAAELVDVLCPDADPALYTWMISEIARLAAGFDAENLATTTTCPVLQGALLRNRFKLLGEVPIQAWIPARAGLPGPVLLGSNTRDTPLNPYAPRWWGDPAPS